MPGAFFSAAATKLILSLSKGVAVFGDATSPLRGLRRWYTVPMQRDDDDLELSSSDSRKYAEAGKGKLRALEAALRREGKDVAAKPLTQEKSKLKLSMLKQSLSGQKDDQDRKRRKEEREKAKRSIGTKTREQQIERSKMDGATKLTGDLLVEQGAGTDKAQDQMRREQEVQQNPT